MQLNPEKVEGDRDMEARFANQCLTGKDQETTNAKPLGDVVRVSVRGGERQNHYKAFQYSGFHYHLDDAVLLLPDESNQEPYVALINCGESSLWPNAAVAALEKACHDALFSDFPKYNQKMRQLTFNIKEGLMAEEMESNEPDELEHMQMTDASCKRCTEKKVDVIDIIHSGRGDRYQLECIACGNTWYAFNDEASALTIEGPSSAKDVGSAPLATAKFEEIEKKLNPDESEGSTDEPFRKTTEAYMPVLNT